jgi:hypothetical protein
MADRQAAETPRGWRDATSLRSVRSVRAVSPHRSQLLTLPAGRLPRVLLGVVVVWFVGVILLDLLIPDSVAVVVTLIGFAPLIAAAVLGPAQTLVLAAVAVGIAALSPLWDSTPSTGAYVVRMLNVVFCGATAVLIAEIRVRREQHLSHVVALAEAAQRAMLPILPSQVGDLRISARYHSAAEEALIGGDLYDFHHEDGGPLRLLVGDVCGKGLDGVQHAARTIRAFRQYAGREGDLVDLAERMNAYMGPFFDAESFVTAVLVEFDDAGSFTVLSCGHPAPLLVSGRDVREVPLTPGPPIGLGVPREATSHSFGSGDRLLLYTDGLIEARDERNRFLPVEEIGALLRQRDEGVESLVALVQEHVVGHRLTDDVCLVLVDNDASVPSPLAGRVFPPLGRPAGQAGVSATPTSTTGSDPASRAAAPASNAKTTAPSSDATEATANPTV